MATITAALTRISAGLYKQSWTLGNADSGNPMRAANLPRKSVQVNGTFGGATVVVEGSADGTTYNALHDDQGNALSFTAAGIENIAENTEYIRVTSSGGAGASVVVTITASSGSNHEG